LKKGLEEFVQWSEEPPLATLNIGTGVSTSIRALALLLSEVMGKPATLDDRGAFRVGDIFSGVGDTIAARAVLGFEPSVPLKKGLEEFVQWSEGQPGLDDHERAEAELRGQGLLGAAKEGRS
jgi:dTDP-L-rhamnose 4-epimerase